MPRIPAPARRRTALARLAALALAWAIAGGAQAEPAFPSRPLTLVVPFAAGGPTDTVARALATGLAAELGQPVEVANVAGLGGTRAPGLLARTTGDGHTLMLHHIGMATAPTLFRHLEYQPLRDFEPLGLVVDAPMVLLSRRDLGIRSARQFAAHVRAHQASLQVAYAGIGAASHLCGLLMGSVLQVDLISVPYKGTGPALQDLAQGAADLLCDQTTAAMAAIRSGAVVAYAVTTPQRLDVLPDLPTTAEAGLPGLQVSIWHGLYAPRGTPADAVARLSAALRGALARPAFVAAMSALGVVPVRAEQATPAAHRAWLAAQIATWRPILLKAGQFAD